MDWFNELLRGQTVAGATLILSLVAALGVAVGSIQVRGIKLGIAGVLFSGLAFGHFGFEINHEVLEFAREFGLILFVYTIGVQVGPGFFASLKREGLPLNAMAAAIVLLGALITVLISKLGGVELAAAVGLFSGATTNTPSLAAAQEAIHDTLGASADAANLPGLGYAIAYPFGILGIIIAMLLIRALVRVDLVKEEEAFRARVGREHETPDRLNLRVDNPNLNGLRLREMPLLRESGVVVSRVMQDDQVKVAQPDTILHTGDILLAVGPRARLEALRLLVGHVSSVDLRAEAQNITTRRIIVTQKRVLGKTVDELGLVTTYDVQFTRLRRAGIEFTLGSTTRLQFGDTVLAVGTEENLGKVALELGNSTKQLTHPEIIPIFVGILLGVVLGSWPIHFPGVPAPVKLGLAGGPLLVAIVLSRLGRVGPVIWYMPDSANFILREVGIVLFLACVGMKSGDRFVATLVEGDGLYWMALATMITFIPLMLVGLFARLAMRVNFLTICGMLAGSMTDPPALAFTGTITGSEGPTVAYATVYPLTMIMRVLVAQLMVLFFL